MKIKILSFKLLFVFFFFACVPKAHDNEKKDLSKVLKPESELPIIIQYYITDSISLSMNVIEPKKNLHPLLDSIIEKTRECPSPRKEIELSPVKGFSFSVWKNMNSKNIRVETISMHRSDFSRFHSFFDYNDYRFYYDGEFLDNFFVKTNLVLTDMYVDPDSLVFDIDDRDYYWSYLIKNNKLQPISFKNCMRSWVSTE